MNTSALDMKKIKEIVDENESLKKLAKHLKKKINDNDFANEIKHLNQQNNLLSERLLRFETIEKKNIKDEIEKNKKEDILNAKKQINIDANQTFGVPIKKPDEEYGTVTTNTKDCLLINHNNIYPANIHSFNAKIRKDCVNIFTGHKGNYDYVNTGGEYWGATGYIVLWIPSTGSINHVFTTKQINLPINLKEIYNY